MGNTFAYLVMLVWPVVIFVTFAKRRGRFSPARTTAWMMLLGIMFLPSSVYLDGPGFPPLDKGRVTALCVRIALELYHPKELLKRAPWHRLPDFLVALMVLTAYPTVNANRVPLTFGSTTLPGLGNGDLISLSLGAVFDVYLPFTIGQRVFRTERDLRDLVDVFGRAMLVYIPFILYELRMAPVLHDKFYGFSPFGFAQAYRQDGYRPAVFMTHGLALAMFIFMAYTMARGQAAARVVTRPFPARVLVLIGFVVLILCKTLAATLYSLLGIVFIRKRIRPLLLSTFLVVISIAVAAYPWLRIEGKFPTYALVEWAERGSAERAESLQFRFYNEDVLLVRGLEQAWWGWGGFGRNRVYNEEGRDVCVTDGLWIMWFGGRGYSGLYLNLAIVLIPLLRAAVNMGKVRLSALPMLASLAVVSAGLAVDLLPNTRFDNLAIFVGGAMFTLSETLTRPLPKARAVKVAAAAAPSEAPAQQAPA